MTPKQKRAEVRRRLGQWLDTVGSEPPHDLPYELCETWIAETKRVAANFVRVANEATETVAPSCGCVFCDLDLVPEMHDGKMQHHVMLSKNLRRKTAPPHSWVECGKSVI